MLVDNRYWRRLCRWGLTCLWLAATLPIPASDASDSTEEDSVARRSRLNHVVYRDRQQQLILNRARQVLNSGRIVEGLQFLQEVFDCSEDSQIWTGQPPRLVSLHQEAQRLLDSLGPDVWRVYQRRFGAQADRLIADAKRSGSPALFGDVVRRYYHTDAGFEAWCWRAARWMDRGEFESAARAWRLLLASPVHRNRVSENVILKAAVAHLWAGQVEQARKIIADAQDGTISVAGQPSSLRDWLANRPSSTPMQTGPVSPDWLCPLGNERRNAAATGSVPFPQPEWVVPLADANHQDVRIRDWEREQIEQLVEPMAVASFPIAVNGQIIIRDHTGIRSVDVHTGRTLWRHVSPVPLTELCNQFESVFRPKQAAFENAFVGNATLGTLASDGRYVYAIDNIPPRLDLDSKAAVGNRTSRGQKREEETSDSQRAIPWNQLIALPITLPNEVQQTMRPAWIAGGRPDGTEPLDGHRFLCAPLLVDGCVYAITESNRQLNLVVLDASDGRLLRAQGIALTEIPLDDESQQFRQASTCSPSFAQGVVVCPTDLGVLVAVDTVTGCLLWSYYYGDLNKPLNPLSLRLAPPQPVPAHVGFLDLPQIHAGRVVCLPRDSRDIHCVDLETGQALWRTPREDALYIGSVKSGHVILVGRAETRALAFDDGKELWSVSVGAPSGRGVPIDDHYLIPLKSGRIASIDTRTGRDTNGTQFPHRIPRLLEDDVQADRVSRGEDVSPTRKDTRNRTSWPIPGNLVVHADQVLSLGAQSLVAFPQAEALLKRTLSHDRPVDVSQDKELLAAELELTLGRFDSAEKRLTTLITSDSNTSTRAKTQSLLRQLYSIQLDDQPRDAGQEALERLGQLSVSAEDRSRYLIQKVRWQMNQGDHFDAVNSAREFASLDSGFIVPLSDVSHHYVASSAWLADAVCRIRTHLSEDRLPELDRKVRQELQDATESEDVDHLRRFVSLYASWPQGSTGRLALARRLIKDGGLLEAELLLLRDRAGSDVRTAALATEILVGLYDQTGSHAEAAQLLEELNSRFADVPLSDGRTGDVFVAQFPKDSLAWQAYRRTLLPEWDVSRVVIRERRLLLADRALIQAYGRFRRRYATPDEFPFQLMEHEFQEDRRISVVDKTTGQVVGHKTIPIRNSFQFWAQTPVIGRCVVMGRPGGMQGLSLLDLETSAPVWNKTFIPLRRSDGVLRPGPVGPDFCVFQASQYLIALDPATGRLLWERSDLEPDSGLFADQLVGLFGDERVLVVLERLETEHGTTPYTVYRTATGEKIRQGRLAVDYGVPRRVFGRRLFYVENSRAGRRMCIWDPLNDRMEWEAPCPGRPVTTVTPENELVVVVPDGRLIVRDVEEGRNRLELKLDREDLLGLSLVRAFSDRERYYFNLGNRPPQSQEKSVHLFSNDVFLPLSQVEGELRAVDRSTGRVLWSQSRPQQSYLNLAYAHLPFLIARSRVREGGNRPSQSMAIEVVDARTGETLAYNDDLLFDRMVHVTYDRDDGRIELRGLNSTIELLFDRQRQSLQLLDGPF